MSDTKRLPCHRNGEHCACFEQGKPCCECGYARTPDPRIAAAEALAEALGGAQTQLNYVGYGDAWEREGTEGLREQISAALAAWEKLQ